MKKNLFWNICWIISILYAVSLLLIPVLLIYYGGDYESRKQFSIIISETFSSTIFSLMGILSFIFWVYNLLLWKKQRRSSLSLILLLFFNVIYTPIFYFKNKEK